MPTSVDQQAEIARQNKKVFDGEIVVSWDTIGQQTKETKSMNRCWSTENLLNTWTLDNPWKRLDSKAI